jgi:hypothetical protein
MNRRAIAVGALALTVAACSGSSSVAEVATTTIPETTTTEAEPVPMLSEVLGFIEVSVRIGVGESAEVVALAVDDEVLGKIELAAPEGSPAWCTGSLTDLAERDRADEFTITLRGPAVDLTLGGAQRFELSASEVILGEAPVDANILLVSDGVRYEVAEGELDLGETFTSGTFRGTTENGTVIEGAFLCG